MDNRSCICESLEAKNFRLFLSWAKFQTMKLVVIIIVILFLSPEVFSQSKGKLNDNIAEYIDSMEITITSRFDTTVKYFVYGLHGDSIPHSFPVQLSFNRSKEIVSATDLRLQHEGKLVYWFNDGKIVVKTTRKQISADQFDISFTKYMNSIDLAFIEAVLIMSSFYQSRLTSPNM